jgi:hypothetical protein
MTRRQRVIAISSSAVAAVTALAVTLVVLLTGSSAPPSSPGAAPAQTASSGPLLSPFTGEPVSALGPVVAVKIDNIMLARPQTGIQSADIVYVLPVEGGLSRFFVVFSSHLPPVIGPVRSAREDDLELLAQFGRPAFAYSGATPHLLPFIHRARIVDLYAGTAKGYYRSADRIAPYNLYARSQVLLAQAKAEGASKAHDIGFRFSVSPPAGGKTVSAQVASYPAAKYTFRWSAAQKRWLTSVDGSPALLTGGTQMGGATVVIQYTTVRTSRFLEYGSPPPFAQSVGSGRAVVLRDGRAYDATWSRGNADAGTVYTLPTGQRMTFAPGQVWVLLVAAPR